MPCVKWTICGIFMSKGPIMNVETKSASYSAENMFTSTLVTFVFRLLYGFQAYHNNSTYQQNNES